MDQDRNSTKKLVFMKKARDYFHKQIEKKEEKLERKLTKEERKESRKKNRKKARLIATVATSFALGVIGGAKGNNLLNSGNTVKVADKSENSVTVDTKEADKVIRIKTDRPVFINGLYVGKDELEIVRNMNQELEINTRREIASLENKPEQVETYIKTLVANDYNQKNETNVTANDIKIERLREHGTIHRVGEEKRQCRDIQIYTGHSMLQKRYFILEDGTIDFSGHPPVEKEIMSLPVVVRGLDWIDKGAQNENLKQAFFESILAYKKSKMKEISSERMKIDDEKEQGYFVDDER